MFEVDYRNSLDEEKSQVNSKEGCWGEERAYNENRRDQWLIENSKILVK